MRQAKRHQSAVGSEPVSAPLGAVGDDHRRMRALEDLVAHVFEVDRERLTQPTRGEAAVARARQVAMYLAHISYGLSHTEVGALFQRDRTTVAYACTLVENRREQREFDRALDILEETARLLAGEAGVA